MLSNWAVWLSASAVAILLIIAPGLRGLSRRICRVYGVYFLVAFVGRGFILDVVQPAPRLNSTFPISTLAIAGYSSSLAVIIPLASVCSLALFVSLNVVSRLFPARPLIYRVTTSVAILTYAVGGIMRLSGLALSTTADWSRLSSIGQTIAIATFAGVVLGTDWRAESSRIVLVMAGAELLFSFLNASKTPLLTVILILYLDPRRRKLSGRAVLAALLSTLVAFTVLQRLKGNGSQSVSDGNLLTEAYFSVTGRLDGLFALAGAWSNGPAAYHPIGGLSSAFARALIPGWLQGGNKELAGLLWGTNVYHVYNGTSYAEGLAGEGYALLGVFGPLLWGLIGGTLLAIVLKIMGSESFFLQTIALAFIGSTVLFERGLLGQFEQFSSAVQGALLATVLVANFSIYGHHRRKARDVPNEFVAPIKS